METRERPDRSHYPVRKTHVDDPEEDDDDVSDTTTAAERLQMVSILTRRCWSLMGETADGIRLQRHVGGPYPRGS